jgi:hypothetical protein
MAQMKIARGDRIGLVHPASDAHTLGISYIEELLSGAGAVPVLAPEEVLRALDHPEAENHARLLRDWALGKGLCAIGYSWRLDPGEGLSLFSRFMDALARTGVLHEGGGPVRSIFFAGLPETCALVEERFPSVAATFRGDEGPAESLSMMGMTGISLPADIARGAVYDESRLSFGRELVRKADYLKVAPVDRSRYRMFGKRGDSVMARVADGTERGLPPLMRAHVGPFLPDRKEAVSLFLDWTDRLAGAGFLDVLSIGTSQLSQSAFGLPWEGLNDGGGVPLATREEFAAVWKAARPMLVRSYAGSRDVPSLARMLEEEIDNAWHALSLWWFSTLDGRGPNNVLENLRQHAAAMRFIAESGKPYEPNVPHHFSFRGGDDFSYVLSGLIAAKAAKRNGIQRLILQVMLNTPRFTSGLGDLAKARALLHLVRELEDGDFKVYLQPRGGLDYFSREPGAAKAQLAAVTALMDDIEPHDPASPQIIHVVGYSEGYALADPDVVDESIRITRHALSEYRRLRAAGEVDDLSSNALVLERTSGLIRDARLAIEAIEARLPDPYSPEGLYAILASGFLAAPLLTACRGEFPAALRWRTRVIGGAVTAVDEDGRPVAAEDRIGEAAENLTAWQARQGPGGAR